MVPKSHTQRLVSHKRTLWTLCRVLSVLCVLCVCVCLFTCVCLRVCVFI